MNILKAMSKKDFDLCMYNLNINDNNVEDITNYCFISITSHDIPIEKHYFKSNHSNVLNLEFHDLDYENQFGMGLSSPRLFSKNDAVKIIDFLFNNYDRNFIIHCTAGESRSGAIAVFIAEIYGYNKFDFKILNPNIRPNEYILKILRDVYNECYACKC